MIDLEKLSELSRALIAAQQEVDLAELELSLKKEQARVLREETIPAFMQELGLEKIVLSDGSALSIKQDVYASIPAAGKPAAYQWLQDNGFGGLIKTELVVNFTKEETDAAVELFKKMSADGMSVELGQDVHAQTLKAFLREQIANAAELPLDLFGARPIWTTKITAKRGLK